MVLTSGCTNHPKLKVFLHMDSETLEKDVSDYLSRYVTDIIDINFKQEVVVSDHEEFTERILYHTCYLVYEPNLFDIHLKD